MYKRVLDLHQSKHKIIDVFNHEYLEKEMLKILDLILLVGGKFCLNFCCVLKNLILKRFFFK